MNKYSSQFSDLRSILVKYTYHWPLFALFLLLSAISAFAYLQIKRPIYEINAAILVRDEKKSPNEKSNLEGIDIASSPKNAESEIQVLTSKKLITQVVSELGLSSRYFIDGFLGKQELYSDRPIILTFSDFKFTGTRELEIIIENEKTLQVSGPNFPARKIAFGETINDRSGTWKFTATTELKNFIGSTIYIHLSDPEKVTKAYNKNLDARLLDKAAPTIGLFITEVMPERGKAFLDGLIKVYNTNAAVEERKLTKSTIAFIDRRLAALSTELRTAENKVEGYRSTEGITDISSQSKVYLENVQANDAKLNLANVRLGKINGVERSLNSPISKSLVSAANGLDDEVLNGLTQTLTQLQLKRVALLTTTPEGNPLFEPIDSQIKNTKAAIRQSVADIKASVQSEKQQLQSIKGSFESAIRNIPGQERQYVGMKRQESIKENQYIYLLQKREELALSYASTEAEARIVDYANTGEVQWPRPSLVIVIALFLGLGIPFLILYFRHSFTRKITSRWEIEQSLEVPIIGEIAYRPWIRNSVMGDQSQNIIGEQFRSIRTKLFQLHQTTQDNKRGKITLCTSSTADEGKSFVASNLACSMAATGRKTVLLEMDLRQPGISSLFHLAHSRVGISEFLSDSASVTEIIAPTTLQDDLFLIGSGQLLNNPSELLENGRLAILLDYLQSQFDEIVIDSPPLHLVTDAMIIAPYAPVTLYLIRQGHTSKDELDFIAEQSKNGRFANLQLVFNGITKGKYGYGYRYDESYYTKKPKGANPIGIWERLTARF